MKKQILKKRNWSKMCFVLFLDIIIAIYLTLGFRYFLTVKVTLDSVNAIRYISMIILHYVIALVFIGYNIFFFEEGCIEEV